MTGRRHVTIPLLLAALLLAVVLIAACGRKGPPVPLRQSAPAAITDLRYEQNDHGITLLWSYPRTMVNGDPLEEIDRFEIFRAEVAETDSCPGCPVPYGEPRPVDGGPVEARAAGRLKVTDLRPGYRYFFKIRALAGWQRIGPDSNVVSVEVNGDF